MRLKGKVNPKVIVHDLQLTILLNQVIEITTAQYSASRELPKMIDGGLIEIVSDTVTAVPSILPTDVDPGTQMIRNGVVTPSKLSAALLQLIGGIAPKTTDLFWTDDPIVGADASEVGRISWKNGNINYLGEMYMLVGGHDEHDHNNKYYDDFVTPMIGVVTLDPESHNATIRFVAHPYVLQAMEFAAVMYSNDAVAFFPLQVGLSTKPVYVNADEIRTRLIEINGTEGEAGEFLFFAPNEYVGLLAMGSDNRVFARPIGNSASDPTATDDYSKGYLPTSMWVNTSSNQAFVCVNNTNGAAVWKQITT